MRRLKAFAAILLSTLFVVEGAFHHHALPQPVHDQLGFYSAATPSGSLESCALCRVAHSSVFLESQANTSAAMDCSSRLAVPTTAFPANAGHALVRDSRAPPTV